MSIIMANPDLTVGPDQREAWVTSSNRRQGFHNLWRQARYGLFLRSPRVLTLNRRIDRRIGDMPEVRRLTGTTFFSAMVVLRHDELVFEAYAPDFGPDRPHTVMSISKTAMNLLIGRLVEEGRLDMLSRVGDHLPEIGSGYADATVQDVMDMNIVNDYAEDYSDPMTTALADHGVAMGWRLAADGQEELSNRSFLCSIASDGLANPSGEPQYKSANTDVVGWVAERVEKRPLRHHFIDIVEGAGIENALWLSCDRDGVPNLNGGVSMSARDLARYGLIFVRGGLGIHGEKIGSEAFIRATRAQTGPRYAPPADHITYGNQMRTNGRWIGHGGWGGQFLFVDPDSGTVVAFFSVLEDDSAADFSYQLETIAMAEAISLMDLV